MVELKRQKDLNKQSRKDKFDTTKQNVDKDKTEENDNDGQRGDRVQQKEDFNGDPETLKDACNDVSTTGKRREEPQKSIPYRQGMKYNKGVTTKTYRHKCDMSKLPEGCVILKTKTRMLKDIQINMNVHEYEWILVKFPDGHIDWVYYPDKNSASQCVDEEYASHIEYRPLGNTGLTVDSMPTLAYLRYALATPANRIAVMLKEAGLGGYRQTILNWLQTGGEQLACLLPTLKDLLLKNGANVNCDETWSHLRLEYRSGYKKVYVWCMVNRKEKICFYFFDKPEEGARRREVLTQFIGDAKVKSLQSDGYVGYVFLDDALVDIDHIYCLAHVRAKFVTAYNIGKVNEAKPFIDWIAEIYKLERHYKTLKLTPDEIKQRRNNKETSEIINKMRLELDRLWPDNK